MKYEVLNRFREKSSQLYMAEKLGCFVYSDDWIDILQKHLDGIFQIVPSLQKAEYVRAVRGSGNRG